MISPAALNGRPQMVSGLYWLDTMVAAMYTQIEQMEKFLFSNAMCIKLPLKPLSEAGHMKIMP